MALKRAGIINDVHMPFEDKARYQVAINIFKKMKIDHLYLNGDILEFGGVSTHPKHPADHVPFCHEIVYANEKFDQLTQDFADVPVTFLEGNHCYRFFRYIRDIAPQMWGLIDCPSILKFPDRPRWKFVPYGPTQLVKVGASNLYLRHEPLSMGANPARGTAEASYIDIGFGHCHRYQTYTHKKFGPIPITNTAYSLGWLGDKSRPVFDYRGAKDTWVEGCTVVEWDDNTGQYSLEFVNLQKLPVLYRGEYFDAHPLHL